MEAAIRLARAAAVRDEVPVGAVVVRDDEGDHVAEAHNEMVHRKDPTAHAELLAIQQALSVLKTDRLSGVTLYITLEPCAQCAGAIILAKVERVVFGAWDQRAGMAGSVMDLLRDPRLNHRPEVLGGVLSEECGEMLRQFFRARRGGGWDGPSS
jgi:tRNA(adenine34) deaminase